MAMGIFKGRSRGDDGVPAIAQPMAPALVATPSPSRRRSGRTASYSVRVAEGFKGEVLRLQAEIQLERQVENGRASKVTEGEVMELMLAALKAARRSGASTGLAVPLSDDVWRGVHEIARADKTSPAQVVEALVVAKVAELGLLPVRR